MRGRIGEGGDCHTIEAALAYIITDFLEQLKVFRGRLEVDGSRKVDSAAASLLQSPPWGKNSKRRLHMPSTRITNYILVTLEVRGVPKGMFERGAV